MISIQTWNENCAFTNKLPPILNESDKMSKGLIKHTSISLRPGQKLVDFIKGLNDTEIELTENILKVYRGFTNDQCSRKTSNDEIVGPQITKNENDYLKKLNAGNGQDELQKCMAELLIDQSSGESSENEEIETVGDDETSSKNEVRRKRAKQREMERAKLTLNLNDMKWLNNHLIERRRNGAETVYLHELLEGSKLILPKNEIIERNPELEARCQRLKREQDERSYQTMTRNVDCSRTKAPDDSIGYQSKLDIAYVFF